MTIQPWLDRVGGWTPARVDLLRHHHTLGMSTTESAEALGGVSPNAVLWERLRLGLSSLGPDAVGALAGFPTGRRLYSIEPPPLPCDPLPDMDCAPPPEARPSLMADRGNRECAWPLGPAGQPGDHRTLYCCAPSANRKSYCAVHAERARWRP